MTWFEDDINWDCERNEGRVIEAYQNLKEKNPNHSLLRFGEVRTKGLIFKSKYFEYSQENYRAYLKKYGSKGKIYPMPAEKYANDLEKALANIK